jgi:hypothetical protein
MAHHLPGRTPSGGLVGLPSGGRGLRPHPAAVSPLRLSKICRVLHRRRGRLSLTARRTPLAIGREILRNAQHRIMDPLYDVIRFSRPARLNRNSSVQSALLLALLGGSGIGTARALDTCLRLRRLFPFPQRGKPPPRRPLPPRPTASPPCPKAVTVSAYTQTAPAPWSLNPCPCLLLHSGRGFLVLASLVQPGNTALPRVPGSPSPTARAGPKCRIGGNPLPSFR